MPSHINGRQAAKSAQGVVLVALMWILAVVSIITLTFAKSIRVEFNAARNNRQQVVANYLARAGMAESTYRLIRRQSLPQQPMGAERSMFAPDDLDRGLVVAEFPEGRVTTRIMDENGKININFTNEEMLRRLMLAAGIEKQQADTIVDSMLDWVDTDKDHRLNGAEDDFYLKLPEPYRAKNGPFETVEELLLVQGVTPEVFTGVKRKDEIGQVIEMYGLANYFTVYSFSTQININSAPLPVLLAIPDMDPSVAKLIFERRQVQPFMNMTEVTQLLPVNLGRAQQWLGVGRSNSFTLESTVELAGSNIKRTLRAVIVLDPQEYSGYRTVYWNELTR